LYINSDMWSAISPGLNPVDYRILGVTCERAYEIPIQDMDEWCHVGG